MAISSTVTTKVPEKPKKPDYPYIGQFKSDFGETFIVLFTSLNRGPLLQKAAGLEVGHAGSWGEENYTVFEGSVTLSN